MSLKSSNIVLIPLTTGGTVTLDNGVVSLPLGSFDENIEKSAVNFVVTGTQTLASDFIITMPSPADNTLVTFFWRARATHGAFTATILGKTIPSDMLLRDFTMKFIALGGSFALLETNLDLTKGGQLPADRLVNASVGTAQMTDASVTYAKMQNVGGDSILFRNSASSGVLSELAVAAQSLIGRIAGRIVNITASVNGTVLKMTGGNIGFAALNFNELAGTIANAQIPDREIALAKLNSTGLLHASVNDSATTAVTTEEVLYTYTLPAGVIANNGEGVEIEVSGTCAGNANVKTIRVKLGTTTYAVNSVTTAPNGVNWYAKLRIIRTGAATSRGIPFMSVGIASEGLGKVDGTPTWANALDIEVTGQNGTASAGDITAHSLTVKVLR